MRSADGSAACLDEESPARASFDISRADVAGVGRAVGAGGVSGDRDRWRHVANHRIADLFELENDVRLPGL